MDLSALIFVALAVAWAVYLIPKALKHHDEVVRSRSVDRFSHTMRVLARREPVNARAARLVVTPGRQASRPTVETKASSAAPSQPSYAARRDAARKATKRRRHVLAAILLANTVVIALAGAQVITWPYVAIPAVLLVMWLVACRVMVKGERAAARPVTITIPVTIPVEVVDEIVDELPETTDSPMVPEVEVRAEGAQPDRAEGAQPDRAEGAWDMVPTTLPTYVSKPAAVRRTVQTIDLDSTGVWSSGRNDDDSALARGAEESERLARAEAERRATGS
ncbi:hypothetical protein [Nocardioides sp.]|uniref:divisome protein SepX/GlpR n=1 Tax=Nocardioides sp. TaxID=35761 RepID=UPI002CE3E67F|nr:hypothetical protein [Nocardioides sp.]HXH80358.1 hypothetical protein [Nocardioides sp.]